jgi:hypothetical protein
MYGLYAEGVVSYKTGKVRLYRRAFLVGDTVYRYDRQPGKKSTIWKSARSTSRVEAEARFFRYFEPTGVLTVAMRGEPLLVQLRLTDILEMEKGKAPASRYVGGAKVEAALGKFDEAAWEAETTKLASPLPDPADSATYSVPIPAGATVTFTDVGPTFTPTSPQGVSKSLPLNWKEILNAK